MLLTCRHSILFLSSTHWTFDHDTFCSCVFIHITFNSQWAATMYQILRAVVQRWEDTTLSKAQCNARHWEAAQWGTERTVGWGEKGWREQGTLSASFSRSSWPSGIPSASEKREWEVTLCHPGLLVLSNSNRPWWLNLFFFCLFFTVPFHAHFITLLFLKKSFQWSLILDQIGTVLVFYFWVFWPFDDFFFFLIRLL